jgi:hypothetical protein
MKLWNTEIRRGGSHVPALLAAVLMVSGPGCASMQLLNLKTDKVPTADAEHPAIEVLAVWQAAEGPGIGGIPTRGFAGQLFFFTQDRAAPVAVDGKARIYVFDDHGSAEQQTRPLRQFDFDRQSWTAHLQSSKLGPTYGVFIPYPRNDYHQAICSLRIRFTPTTKGRPLFSTSSTIVLPGPPLKPEAEMAHASPLDSLAKKLQSQSLKAAWKPALVDTDARPFAMNPQIAGAQTPEMASGDRPTVALLPAPNPVVAPEDPSNLQAGSSLAAYASSQAGRGAMLRSNPILQTAGTAYLGQAQANGAANNTAGIAAATAAGGVSTSGRIKLQAVSADTDWSSDPESLGNTETQRLPDAWNGPPAARPAHPLAD